MLRHTAIGEVAKRAGLQAAHAQAGHRDIAITTNVYTHTDNETKIESAEILGAFLQQLRGTAKV